MPDRMNNLLVWLMAVTWPLVALVSGVAGAAPPDAPFEWTQPEPMVQLEGDSTAIPVGKGAVFVPAMTDPLNEPRPLLVNEATDEVLDIPTGERFIVDPGNYVVIVTSGSPGQGVGQAITVTDGETALVPVTWGALRIEVVDDRRVPHRGGYEIIRADTREPFGAGFGADTLQGEKLRSWLLPPGVYRIVRQGSNYRALRDFATVYVPPGGFVRYRLVLDPDTGEFQGSGVLLPDEFGSPKDDDEKKLFTSLIVGAVGSFANQNTGVGSNNQTTLAGSLFVDGQFAYNTPKHSATVLLQVEEGGSWIDTQEGDPLVVKTRDRIRLDTLYTFFLRPRFGPYARAAAETQALATNLLVTEDTVFQEIDSDEQPIGPREAVGSNELFLLADPWSPTIIREGVGLNARLVRSRWLTLNWRLGLGLRQNRFEGALRIVDTIEEATGGTDVTQVTRYERIASYDQAGIESTVLATARLGGWVVYGTDLELFAEFGDFGDEPGDGLKRYTIEWRNTLNLRLTRNLSFIYFLSLERNPRALGDDLQLEQSVLMRASWAIL